ncbi:MAG: 3-oxo-tetronate kinase [Pseudomonadota bacterium]|nr:3-oxo-tetronate kinase [Pseudomonadota bacterium]
MQLGCIADDFTGATDLAGTLVKSGMSAVQLIGVPEGNIPPVEADAGVVALKSRTIPAAEAVAQSIAALDWLRDQGCTQFFFKYCSTFDSTDDGNIGPVADALMAALDTEFTIFCPAFPANGRTIFKGYLFAGDVLLNESGMQDHPLTPMTDPNLVRVLQRQTKSKAGLVDHNTVGQGAGAVRAAFDSLKADGVRMAVVDATNEADLMTIGAAANGMAMVTGGSGIAIGLPNNFKIADGAADQLPKVEGLSAVISGSCSRATQGQVANFMRNHPAFQIEPLKLAAGQDRAAAALEWALPKIADGPVLIYSTDQPGEVQAVQAEIGREAAGDMVEQALARVAAGLVKAGVRKLIVAGGETSGAVVGNLGVRGLRIGPEIDPGVPWTVSLGDPEIALALKSGNFGGPNFFEDAFGKLT